MAGNTRGRLKEQFEGVHRNFEWQTVHLERALLLIGEYNPKLSKSILTLHDALLELDKLAQKIYQCL